MALEFTLLRADPMSDEKKAQYNDGLADAIAATAVISLVVITLWYWLSGMPS